MFDLLSKTRILHSYGKKPLILLSIALLLSILAVQNLPAQDTVPPSQKLQAVPQDFKPISAESGWLLMNGRLFWTADGGTAWENRTPANLGLRQILSTHFINENEGWLAAGTLSTEGKPSISIAHTTDGGKTWTWPAQLLEDSAGINLPSDAHLFFLNNTHGWLVVKLQSSSNFNSGLLFSTADGGKTWVKRQAVSGNPVHFISPVLGWMLAGPLDDRLYQTADGGSSWQQLQLSNLEENDRHQFTLPSLSDDGRLILSALISEGEQTLLRRYQSFDLGQNWQHVDQKRFDLEFGQAVPVVQIQTKTLITVPGKEWATDTLQGQALGSQIVQAPHFQAYSMATAAIGWGLRLDGHCRQKEDCEQIIQLYKTADGGLSWTLMAAPQELPVESIEKEWEKPSVPAAEAGTSPFVGQGFDTCEIPTVNQLENWMAGSPYEAVNLYIGGSCRFCSNSGLTPENLVQIEDQGWKFIPTWVGPQSSCSSSCGGRKISNNTTTAYQQGLDEAEAALAKAVELDLAAPDGSGAVIYYDLEAFNLSSSSTCRNAAQSFVSGWSKGLRDNGSTAGLYGATCGSFFSDFATIDNPPDAIWAAYWAYSFYNSNASVWNLLCLDNALWPDQQRIRQYAGDHFESWGGTSIRIDSNVLNGIVDSLYTGTTATPSPTATETQQPTATATPTASASPTSTATNTVSPTFTATATQTQIPTATATPSFTPTATSSPSPTPSPTETSSPTVIPTMTASATATGTVTATPTATATATAVPTATPTPSSENLFFLPTVFNDAPLGISGRIIDQAGNGVPNVTINLVGVAQTTSGARGLYGIRDLTPGTYTIRPERAGYIFEPAERTLILPPSSGQQDFVARLDPYPGP